MIEAAAQAVELVEGVAVEDLAADRVQRDALLWNFAVLGEAAGGESGTGSTYGSSKSGPAAVLLVQHLGLGAST